MTTGHIIKFALVVLSVLFYITSLFLPVFIYPNGETIYLGIECLFAGWLSIPYGWQYFAVYVSNFLYFISIPLGFFRITGYVSIVLMVPALVLAAMVFGNFEVVNIKTGEMVDAELGSGAYLWYISYCVLFISFFIPAKWFVRSEKKKGETDFTPDVSEIY